MKKKARAIQFWAEPGGTYVNGVLLVYTYALFDDGKVRVWHKDLRAWSDVHIPTEVEVDEEG
jgi:hypothetical protein